MLHRLLRSSTPLLLLVAPIAQAVPMEVAYQGRLLDNAGVPIDGSHDLTVLLYETPSGGTSVWSDQFMGQDFDDGYFSVVLGSGEALTPEHFASDTLYVALSIDTGDEFPTRQKLASVPFAMVTDTARNVRGGVAAPSVLQLPSTDDIPCDDDALGTLRYNTQLGVPEFCGETGWTTLGAPRPDLTITQPLVFPDAVFTPGREVPDAIAYRITPPADGADTITRFDAADDLSVGFARGDQALLINLQGTVGDSDDVGSHEVVTILDAEPTGITFTEPVSRSYDGTSPSAQKVVLQRIPTYNSVAIEAGGGLTAASWDGLSSRPYRTGIVAMRVVGGMTIAPGGYLSASGAGFRGGSRSSSGYCRYAANGEGMNQPNRSVEGSENIGGGKGGSREGSWCVSSGGNHQAMAGGGASHATAGTDGLNSQAGTPYGDADLTDLFLGSGGGGASSYRHNSGSGYGGAGGSGGGIVYVMAGSVDNDGVIAANGSNGANGVTHGGGGGGGAGGSVRVIASELSAGTVQVAGGTGGGGYSSAVGGNGGSGWARLEP